MAARAVFQPARREEAVKENGKDAGKDRAERTFSQLFGLPSPQSLPCRGSCPTAQEPSASGSSVKIASALAGGANAGSRSELGVGGFASRPHLHEGS